MKHLTKHWEKFLREYLSSVIDRGTMEKDVSIDENADPSKYQAQSIMRYNVLFTQTVNMTVPCNTNLRAGDVHQDVFSLKFQEVMVLNLIRIKVVYI